MYVHTLFQTSFFSAKKLPLADRLRETYWGLTSSGVAFTEWASFSYVAWRGKPENAAVRVHYAVSYARDQ